MDHWDKQQYLEAEEIFKVQYKDEKINSLEDLDDLVADLMVKHGPDGHCDGHHLITLTLWRLLKKDLDAKPDYNSKDI